MSPGDAPTCARCHDSPAQPDRDVCADCAEERLELLRRRLSARTEGPRRLPREAQPAIHEGDDHWPVPIELTRPAGPLCNRCRRQPPVRGKRLCLRCARFEEPEPRLVPPAPVPTTSSATPAPICTSCENRAPVPGRRLCPVCAEQRAAWRRQKRAAGLCRCGQPSRPERTTCATCAAADVARVAAVRAQRAAAGMCIGCPAPGSDGVRCMACAAKLAAAQRAVRARSSGQRHPA